MNEPPLLPRNRMNSHVTDNQPQQNTVYIGVELGAIPIYASILLGASI
jgi:hypothetical protein